MTSLRLLGTSEVAALLGVSRQAISNLRARNPEFPAPIAELKSGPVWKEEDIRAWAEKSAVQIVEKAADPGSSKSTRKAVTVGFVNMKGGVGKSTLTANLGWWCAYQQDKRVLLVDLDPQFNLSQYVLGFEKYEELIHANKPTVLDIFEELTPPVLSRGTEKNDPNSSVVTVRKWFAGGKLDVIPSRLELAWTLKNPHFKERLLSKFLKKMEYEYDLIAIDCPPTESILTEAAYLASDYILVPVKPDFFSAIGLPLLARSLNDFKSRYEDHEIDIAGILFNSIVESKPEHGRSKALVLSTAKKYDWYVFKNQISYSDSYPKGARVGKPIFSTAYARWEKRSELGEVASEFMKRVGL